MQLAISVLKEFLVFSARYWGVLLWLVLLYLSIILWPFGGRRPSTVPDSNAAVLDYFFRRGYHLEDEVFQGRLGAEFVLSKLGAATLVHIKWWQKPVGSRQIQELAAAQRKLYCKHAILISKEGFTRAAQREAAAAGVWLWDFYSIETELERFSASLAMGQKAVAATGDSQ